MARYVLHILRHTHEQDLHVLPSPALPCVIIALLRPIILLRKFYAHHLTYNLSFFPLTHAPSAKDVSSPQCPQTSLPLYNSHTPDSSP
jgi:hypothetical protein